MFIETENKTEVEKNLILNNRKETCLEKYGVDNYSQTDEFKVKFKNTLMERYGVETPMHSDIIFNKQQISAFKLKKHENTNLSYQGTYELDFLEKYHDRLQILKINPIQYFLNENIHYYHPDFYLPDYNLIIEIKSTYTYNNDLEKNLVKREYCLKYGYDFIFIIDKDYYELDNIINPKDH